MRCASSESVSIAAFWLTTMSRCRQPVKADNGPGLNPGRCYKSAGLEEAVLGEEGLGHVWHLLVVDLNLLVEVDHGGVVQLGDHRGHDRADLRVSVLDAALEEQTDVVWREELLVVLEDVEVLGADRRIGREDLAGLTLTAGDGRLIRGLTGGLHPRDVEVAVGGLQPW